MTDPRPIVVGYDGRAGSRAALDEALRLAEDLGAPVVAVFSFEPTRLGGEARDLDEAVTERARVVLEAVAARAAGTGVAVETVHTPAVAVGGAAGGGRGPARADARGRIDRGGAAARDPRGVDALQAAAPQHPAGPRRARGLSAGW